jgi:hypothetical protein
MYDPEETDAQPWGAQLSSYISLIPPRSPRFSPLEHICAIQQQRNNTAICTTLVSPANAMPFKALIQVLALSLAIAPAAIVCDQLHALVYRGPTASEGLPESRRDLLVASHSNNVTFAGPNEPVKINAESLSYVDILAQPGGPGA